MKTFGNVFHKSSLWNIVNDVVLVFLLLTLNIFHTFFSSVSIADFEKVNVWIWPNQIWLIFGLIFLPISSSVSASPDETPAQNDRRWHNLQLDNNFIINTWSCDDKMTVPCFLKIMIMMMMSCFCGMADRRLLALLIIVRDPHHRESPTHREQDLNLCRTWVQALMNEDVQ